MDDEQWVCCGGATNDGKLLISFDGGDTWIEIGAITNGEVKIEVPE